MKEVVFKLYRDTYRGMTTIGKMYTPELKFFGYTLEDIVRAFGIKDAENTAIPSGRYQLKVSMSDRFKRNMVLIFNKSNLTVDSNGVKFSGVRVHGGNTHLNTEGCVLIAKNKISDQKIQGTLEKEFTALVQQYEDDGYTVYLEIENLPQAS